jgi:hypothetical protein
MTVCQVTHDAAKQRIKTNLGRIVGDVTNYHIKRTSRGVHHTWQMPDVRFLEQFAQRYWRDCIRRRLHD